MPRPDKVAVVDATKESAEKANSIVLANFTGINVERDTEMRQKMRESSVDYKVVKNRLAKISFQELGYDDLIEHLSGPTSIAFGNDDPVASLRIILEESKKTEIPKIKAILFEGQLFPAEDAKKLVNLPSRDQLIAQFIGGLNAPITGLVGNLNGILQKFVGTLGAIQKQKEEDQ
jgi:large subunit ribosomal protein L10